MINTKRALVTGPNGFVGYLVCNELLKRNHIVRAAQWKADYIPKACESSIVGNIDADTDWKLALKDVDTVLHLAARVHVMDDTAADPIPAFRKVNVEGTRRLAECAAKAGVEHFIFVSTIKVHGEATENNPFAEADDASPEEPYSISKWEAEQLLREIEASTDMSVTILRPPLIYGPRVKANFYRLFMMVAKGVPLPFRAVINKRSLLGLSNFADLICRCMEHPAARSETFVLSDGNDLSTPDLVRKIGCALEKKPRLIAVNPYVLRMLGYISGKYNVVKRLTESLEIDSSKVQRMLDWKAPFSIDDELARTAEWYYNSQRS